MMTDTDQLMRAGRWLKAMREARGQTLRDVERGSGVIQQTLSSLENGKTDKPAFETMSKLAAYYGVNPNRVAQEYGWWHGPVDDPLLVRLETRLAQAEPEERNRLRAQIEGLLDVAEKR